MCFGASQQKQTSPTYRRPFSTAWCAPTQSVSSTTTQTSAGPPATSGPRDLVGRSDGARQEDRRRRRRCEQQSISPPCFVSGFYLLCLIHRIRNKVVAIIGSEGDRWCRRYEQEDAFLFFFFPHRYACNPLSVQNVEGDGGDLCHRSRLFLVCCRHHEKKQVDSASG